MERQQQTALLGTADGRIGLVRDAPVPRASGDRVLLQVKAVAVNPVDTKVVGPYITPGATAGFELAGVVVDVGPEAKESGFQVGDRVCSAVLGMNPDRPTVGAFAEYTTVSKSFLIRVPSSWRLEEGASLCISFLTVGMALFYTMALPGRPLAPCPKPIPVLVFGGSSSTGAAAIQLLKLAGYDPISTCSPNNFEYVRSCGASAVFDYKAEDATNEIKRYTRNGLRYAMDCISTTGSMQFCYQSIGRAGGKYVTLEPFSEAIAKSRKVVAADWVMGPQLLGEGIRWPKPHSRAADSAVAEFGVEWVTIVNKVLEKGLLTPPPLEIRRGRLEDVLNGIDDVREKRVKGKKLVYLL